ncbi:Histidine kinase [Roseateles sp. YR242]|uniref:histidine kinase dimerization/phosphoacceptor domain-containing protein n=1 Tax=Roseateles sp. YR242 TaxID=1855305 RepID=UPI0008C7864E|nr:histidine kinase dimerization/phosphoacceptor domain-containing protein [Roseateles sp. YR242]SEK34907.1 Histidine kinase [Roseateles sp. YR242]
MWLLCLLAALGIALLVWLILRGHIGLLGARKRMRFERRMAERAGISRELHDALLQGTQGLILQIQAVVDQMPVGDPSRKALVDALDRGESILTEGRDQLLDLRDAV